MVRSVILRVTGILLMLFSLVLLAPIIVAVVYDELSIRAFFSAALITFSTGLFFSLIARSSRELRSRDGFVITALFYFALGMFGALPFYLEPSVAISFTDAVFESVSGFTTTGATVLTGLDDMPRSVLFYRQLLQWLGGMGIIILAVAILPMLGVGGMQLYRTEYTGPVKDTKLTPRITETAKALWYIYLSLTVACAVGYRLAGMSWFDAISHSFSTVSIGGYSTYDASIGHFDSAAVEAVAIVFMIIAGINFGLHFVAWHRRSLVAYAADWEVRTYLSILAGMFVIIVSILLLTQSSANPIRQGLFQAVSISTTTGFTTADFSAWPSAAPFLLLLGAFAGGCVGSTGGGIKILRVLLIAMQGVREMRRLIHPAGVFHIKLGREPVPARVIDSVWGFFSAYVLAFIAMVCIFLVISDSDFVTAFSAVAACQTNLGPGLGAVAANYQGLEPGAKWLLVFAMVLGRLEVFTLLVLFMPSFWRR
jgi:trk system potassium uptake protein